jgi:hypothetical protein
MIFNELQRRHYKRSEGTLPGRSEGALPEHSDLIQQPTHDTSQFPYAPLNAFLFFSFSCHT